MQHPEPIMRTILFCLAALATGCVAQDLGYVDNFRVLDFGPNYINVGWDFVEGDPDYPLHKYSLVIDNDLTSEFKCTDSSCTKTIYDLESCVEHTFDLKPILYTPTGEDTEGAVATTTGYTEDELPGAVNNIVVTADTDAGTTLTWSEPSANGKCVGSYQVCVRQDGHITQSCVTSDTTQVTIEGLSACGLFHVYVTPVTPSNSLGVTFEDTFQTRDGVPGEPQDVVVGLITPEKIQLLWNNPAENLLCLDKFLITIGETHVTVLKSQSRPHATGYDNEFTFNPLIPCTDYTIDVCSANVAEETSDKVVRYASTDETEPEAPPTVIVTPNGPNSIEVSWGQNENDRCAGSFEVCWNDGVHPVEQCEEVGGDGDNSLIIHDLLPCSMYDIIVSVVSPNGTFTSNSTSNSTATTDVQPGPVVDLKFESVEVNQLTISYLPPETDPQCVKEIITRVIDDNQRLRWNKATTVYEETITGLEACTDYTVQVSTVSPSGLESIVEEISNTTLADMPSAPQELGANTITTTSITLQWFQPAENPRCVTAYLLTWSDSTTIDSATVDSPTFKVEYTVEGLSACTSYDFTLVSDSSVGQSTEATLTLSTAC